MEVDFIVYTYRADANPQCHAYGFVVKDEAEKAASGLREGAGAPELVMVLPLEVYSPAV